MIHCLPFYRGYLRINFMEGIVTNLEYVNFPCDSSHDVQNKVIRMLLEYSRGKRVDFLDVEIRYPYGTMFEQEVWNIVREIPYGEMRTYGWVAEKLGNKKLSRAVGNALGKNPVMIIVPCHRVIRSDGRLGGFSSVGGVEIKKFLLKLEKIL